MGDDEWLRVVDVNLNGMFYCCRAFGRFMVDAGRGSIVNFGSDSGFTVDVPQPQAHYNASKAGVHMLTKSLAVEWAKTGVRVNAVAPGYVRTEMTLAGLQNAEWNRVWHERTPIGGLGEPDEVAPAKPGLAARTAVRGKQPHQREEDLALARAAFTDDSQHLAAREVEVDAVDRRHFGLRQAEAHAEPAHREEGLSGHWGRRHRAARPL